MDIVVLIAKILGVWTLVSIPAAIFVGRWLKAASAGDRQ